MEERVKLGSHGCVRLIFSRQGRRALAAMVLCVAARGIFVIVNIISAAMLVVSVVSPGLQQRCNLAMSALYCLISLWPSWCATLVQPTVRAKKAGKNIGELLGCLARPRAAGTAPSYCGCFCFLMRKANIVATLFKIKRLSNQQHQPATAILPLLSSI